MTTISPSKADIDRFDELSRWTETWLRDKLPRFAGISPQTGDPQDLMLIEERLRSHPDAWLMQLGKNGPVFCDLCIRLHSSLWLYGSFVARLGFVASDGNDVSRTIGDRDPLGSLRSFPSAHAAAMWWIDAVGGLFFGLEPWCHAIENGSPFPDRHYLEVVSEWWQAVSEEGERWTARHTAAVLQRICWPSTSDGLVMMFQRMADERGRLQAQFLEVLPTKLNTQNDDASKMFLGLSVDLKNRALLRDGFPEPVSFIGQDEKWPVIQRLVANRESGLTPAQRKEIEPNREQNAWRQLKIALNNLLGPLEVRVSPREWRLEEILG